MHISLIVACTKNGVIGYQNKIPWHLPDDLKHFKSITMGKPIVMGRKTFNSIGHALPGRRNIIISHQNIQPLNCEIYSSVDAALKQLQSEKEVIIIGGAQLFEQILPLASRIYLTQINAELLGDTFFPALNPKEWKLISEKSFLPDEKNRYAYCFQIWER